MEVFVRGGQFTKKKNEQTQKPQLLVQLEALTTSGYPGCDVGILGDFPGRTDTDTSLFGSVLFPSVCPWKYRLVAGPGTVGPRGSTEEGSHVQLGSRHHGQSRVTVNCSPPKFLHMRK